MCTHNACSNGSIGVGVVLYESVVNNRLMVVSLQRSGTAWEHNRNDVTLVIPGFVDRGLVTRCGTGLLQELTPHNLEARLEVLRRLVDFERALEDVSNAVAKSVAELYEVIRHPDPHTWGMVTLSDIVERISVRALSPLLKMFAVHRHLMNRPALFVADPITYRVDQRFAVRPKSDVELIAHVQQMVRVRDPALASFAEKAKRVIARAEAAASATWAEPAQPGVPDPDIAYTAEEQAIAKFLRVAFHKRRWLQTDPTAVAMNAIIKSILDLGDKPIDETITHALMVNLGIIAPWQDPAEAEMEVNLRTRPRQTAAALQREEDIVNRYLENSKALAATARAEALSGANATSKSNVSTRATPLQPLGPEDLYAQDPTDSIRHDFGDMNVFVIDDDGAHELDDGLSIEPDPKDPESRWIHVHIADPTSVIPPTHVFAQRARQLVQTSYFLQGNVPMLPEALMPHGLSLGSAMSRANPQRVLTFSARIDGEGAIRDFQVRAGLVRNLHTLKYDDVDAMLGTTDSSAVSFPFGRGGLPERIARPVPSRFKAELKDIFAVSRRLLNAKRQLPVFFTAMPEGEVHGLQQDLPPGPHNFERPTRFAGFPSLTYGVSSMMYRPGARQMVSEFMMVASRVASRFAVERRLPGIRRAGAQVLTPSDDAFQELLDARDESGAVDYVLAACLGAVIPPGGYSLEPAEHWQLGIPAGEGYMRVTSPLRRFCDLAMHWQIKSALLGQRPAFDRTALRQVLTDVTLREAQGKAVSTLHKRFWTLVFLRRWLEDPARGDARDAAHVDLQRMNARLAAASVPDVLGGGNTARVYLPGLAMIGAMVDAPPPEEAPVGMRVRVKLDRIEVGYNPRLVVKPA
jgi:exoribonuclease-2